MFTLSELRALLDAATDALAGEMDVSAKRAQALNDGAAKLCELIKLVQKGGVIIALSKAEQRALSFVAGEWFNAEPGRVDEWFHTKAERDAAWRAWRKLIGSPEPEEK